MNLLTAENISKSYNEKKLFCNIDFGINEGDKIGLIGVNGTGKTTLLKILSGFEHPDTGKVIKGSSVNIEYLPQNPYFDAQSTVLEQVFKGTSEVMKLIREYEKAIEKPEINSDRILKLSREMDAQNAWSLESDAKSKLTKLGIYDFNAKIESLSGGQRKRIALASAIINPSDLLILDEPTNHLDNDVIDELEQYLCKFKGSILMVTHDRYFLDRVVNVILELDNGKLYSYKGNYSAFLDMKLQREEIEKSNEKKKQRLLKQELAWIKKGAKARSTKQKARIERFEKLNDEAASDNMNEKIEISSASSRLGKKVIEIDNISKSYNKNKVVDGFNYIVLRNDRVGIIGPNGCGKTTLVNMICKKLQPDSGSVEIGETVKIGLFAQENVDIDENLRVIEYIKEAAEYIINSDSERVSASQMLETFLFPPSEQWTPISKLSGGEKRRLYLLRVLMESPNVLVLDEPTNDLDIETLAILEDYIDSFNGAVIAVSHDRYFLNRISEKIFSFEGNGKIIQYTGNYFDYKEALDETLDLQKKEQKNQNNKSKSCEKLKREKPLKFSYNEQKEFKTIDSDIAEIEEKLKAIDEKIDASSSDYELLQNLISDKGKLESELNHKMERWLYLNELKEKIEAEKDNI
jgi:ATP-binding cassette subfamily F protein uup